MILCVNNFVFGQIGPGVGADTLDAKKIILEASKAFKNVKNINYKANYRGTGAFSTHTQNVSGEVVIEKLASDNPLRAKFAASGLYISTGGDEIQNFHTTFNGTTVYKLRPKENAVLQKTLEVNSPTERKLGFVTSFFGGGPYQLTMLEFVEAEPLARQTQADVLDYEGRTVVEGIPCHVIYIEYSTEFMGNKRKTRERWYFGTKDNLPRKFESLVTDDKGRHGSYELTLSDLKINTKLNDSVFKVVNPKGYSIKQYEPPTPPASLPINSIAPEWKLFDENNREHSLQNYRGKIVIMDFWATWCGPCIRAMPDLQKLHDKFKSRGVEVFGVNAWEESNAAAYMKQRGFTYNLLLKGEEIGKLYNVSTLPSMYIIGIDGKIIYHATGLPKDVESFLEDYLKRVDSQKTP
jgi:thiol-disulfide isomerase/thioredoxin